MTPFIDGLKEASSTSTFFLLKSFCFIAILYSVLSVLSFAKSSSNLTVEVKLSSTPKGIISICELSFTPIKIPSASFETSIFPSCSTICASISATLLWASVNSGFVVILKSYSSCCVFKF